MCNNQRRQIVGKCQIRLNLYINPWIKMKVDMEQGFLKEKTK